MAGIPTHVQPLVMVLLAARLIVASGPAWQPASRLSLPAKVASTSTGAVPSLPLPTAVQHAYMERGVGGLVSSALVPFLTSAFIRLRNTCEWAGW